MDAFAAQIAAMDMVITIDNSTAHLAGALGTPVWVLLPFAPDWRWLLETSRSPWYPTMKLFRQSQPGDWRSVVARVKTALAAKSDELLQKSRLRQVAEEPSRHGPAPGGIPGAKPKPT
jgi:ADP-heptose:LPS heptosyltransferase